MGYILVRPRDPKDAKGFRGLLVPFVWADKVINLAKEMGGPAHAQILIIGDEDGSKINVQVYEPKAGEGSGQVAP